MTITYKVLYFEKKEVKEAIIKDDSYSDAIEQFKFMYPTKKWQVVLEMPPIKKIALVDINGNRI